MIALRTWPAIFLIGLIFVLRYTPMLVNNGPDWLWMVGAFGPLVCCLAILIWWLAASRASWQEKLLGLLGIALALFITVPGLDPTMKGPGMITLTIPMGFLGFAAAAILLSRWLNRRRIVAMVGVCIACFAFSLLIRNEGMWGNGVQDFRWRWTETAEERMLASKKVDQSPGAQASSSQASPMGSVEWPGFRGSNRDGRQSGDIIFGTDWKTSPPEEIWRIAVGPGWSSFAVAGDRIFTQEQRGPDEYLVCYAAGSGEELWTCLAGGRFDDPMGGPGPRATPELSGDAVFGLTAGGVLLSVDAVSGESRWKKDISEIANRKPPMWGYSSSPLVTESVVIVHAGGSGDKGTFAFDRETGDLTWSAPAGDHSYSSPQLSSLLGEEFILMATNRGLRLLDPDSGSVRYFHESRYNGYRTLQPQLLGNDSVLMQASGGPGTYRLQFSRSGDEITGSETWNSTWLKADFNDCVVHGGYLYGFNGSVLVCLDIETGERKWRGGRYGKGQLLLLEKSGLLLVISERGMAALVRVTPDGHEELTSLEIFEGKSWSHPVVVGDRLYLRNSTEAVCYRLPGS